MIAAPHHNEDTDEEEEDEYEDWDELWVDDVEYLCENECGMRLIDGNVAVEDTSGGKVAAFAGGR